MSNEEMAELVKQGQRQYISELWEQMKRLLFGYALKYFNKYNSRFIRCGVTLEDLEQECFIILLNMVEAYNPEKGYKLASYTEYQFKNHLRNLLKIGENVAEDPLNTCDSFDRVIGGEDEDITVGDVTKDKNAELAFEDTDERVYQEQLHDALETAMNTRLDEEQKAIIIDRFYNSRTLKECGEQHGMSTERVRQVERDSLRRLKYSRALASFKENVISSKAYQGTSLGAFRYNQASSTERAVEYLEHLKLLYINK